MDCIAGGILRQAIQKDQRKNSDRINRIYPPLAGWHDVRMPKVAKAKEKTGHLSQRCAPVE
jgi:hypothetical protein